ncbi:MAG: hypothetical protein U0872_15330 [Planctomycetaceae bacterium]
MITAADIARLFMYREAIASCSLDGDTQCCEDGPPYVLTPDLRLITERQWKREEPDHAD